MKRRIYLMISAGIAAFFALTSCSDMSSDAGAGDEGGGGQGGSMARFTIVGDYLYTVDNRSMRIVDIKDPANPRFDGRNDFVYVGFDIETIFAYNDMLFVGSRNAMYIYDISIPNRPNKLSETRHFSSCDPIVAAGDYAYVTLNSDSPVCFRGADELQVYNISDPTKPVKVFTDRNLDAPKGLGVDLAAERLFVCVKNNLNVYDISNPASPVFIEDLRMIPNVSRIDTYDVIPRNGLLIVIGADGLYQFDYTGENLTFISKIDLNR